MRNATLILTLILAGCAAELPDESGGGDESGGDESGGDGDVSSAAETHNPDNCPGGGGGGGGGADPNPIPAPRDCTAEVTHEACYACCNWNVDNVWGARCNRIPKKNRYERRRCWEDAEARRKDCQLLCPRPDPIITIGVLP
jgi:hypothetical protein